MNDPKSEAPLNRVERRSVEKAARTTDRGAGPDLAGSAALWSRALTDRRPVDPARRTAVVLGLQQRLGNAYVQRLIRRRKAASAKGKAPDENASDLALGGSGDAAFSGDLALSRRPTSTRAPRQTEALAGPEPSQGLALEDEEPENQSGFALGPVAAAFGGAGEGPPAPAAVLQRAPPVAVDNIAKLDELLDKIFKPKEQIVRLLGDMTPAEKHTVLVGYGDKLGHVLSFSQMKLAVTNLGAELPVALDWLQKASLLTSLISYTEIQSLVVAAPQSERDMLKNERWKSFFLSVCNNATIITAMIDLGFDLPTKLTWIKGEASALFSLDLPKLKPLLTGAPQPELDIVGGDFWLGFWTDVCTNATMAELVDILFPTSLVRKLEWMAEEGSTLPLVQGKLAAADAAQKLAVFGSPKVQKMMVGLCNDKEMISFVLDLGGDWTKWRPWVVAEGAKFKELARAAVDRALITEPLILAFAKFMLASPSTKTASAYLVKLSDAELATVRANPMTLDLINDVFESDAEVVVPALNGEIASGEKKVTNSEWLQTGPTSAPFVPQQFGDDHRFNITLRRDRVDVDVGVELKAVDDRAKELLPTASGIWSGNITGAWDNVFKLENSVRTIPLRFHINLGGGSNKVNVHSGVWAWPALNAGNWFVPDDRVPTQKDAVSKAPVHEFGHLIGNLDEYSILAAHYVAVTGQSPTLPGGAARPGVTAETDTARTTRYTNNLTIMGAGTTVLARHVQGIVDWCNANLRPGEPPFRIK